MASKRPRPYDVPPSPESSEEEEDVEEEQEEQEEEEQTPAIQTPSKQQHSEEEEGEEEEEEEDEDPEEEEEEEEEEESDENNNTNTPVEPIKKTTEPVSDSGSDTETDTTPKTSSYTIKPIVKEKVVKASKPDKEKVKEEEEKKGSSMINRVWSFSDEISVMQAMIDFRKENNKDPTSSHEEFFNFVKGRLGNGKFTKVQVMDKVRRLKKKYKNNLSKSSSTGKDPEFSNPHELKSFKLSKKIWGDLINGNNNNANVVHVNSNNSNVKATVVSLPVVNGSESNGNGKTSTKSAKRSKTTSLEKASPRVEEDDMMEVDEEKKRKGGKVEEKDGEENFGELYPHLMKAFEGESVPRVPLLDGLKGCLSSVESSKLEEWDRKWKKVRLAETDAYISRLALIQEQTSWFSNAMKSSKY